MTRSTRSAAREVQEAVQEPPQSPSIPLNLPLHIKADIDMARGGGYGSKGKKWSKPASAGAAKRKLSEATVDDTEEDEGEKLEYSMRPNKTIKRVTEEEALERDGEEILDTEKWDQELPIGPYKGIDKDVWWKLSDKRRCTISEWKGETIINFREYYMNYAYKWFPGTKVRLVFPLFN